MQQYQYEWKPNKERMRIRQPESHWVCSFLPKPASTAPGSSAGLAYRFTGHAPQVVRYFEDPSCVQFSSCFGFKVGEDRTKRTSDVTWTISRLGETTRKPVFLTISTRWMSHRLLLYIVWELNPRWLCVWLKIHIWKAVSLTCAPQDIRERRSYSTGLCRKRWYFLD